MHHLCHCCFSTKSPPRVTDFHGAKWYQPDLEVNQGVTKYFWKGLAKVINFTFWPVDGPDHCKQAFEADPQEIFNDKNGDVFRVLLTVIIVATCIPISIILYAQWAIRKLVT